MTKGNICSTPQYENLKIVKNNKSFSQEDLESKFVKAIIKDHEELYGRLITAVYEKNNTEIEAVKIRFSHRMSRDRYNLLDSYLTYYGLCDIICNYMIWHDELGDFSKPDFDLTFEDLLTCELSESHFVNVIESHDDVKLARIQWSFFNDFKQQIINSNSDESEKLLLDLFVNQANGQYTKLLLYKESESAFSGHSVLIKKLGPDKYSFFDPYSGENDGTIQELLLQISTNRIKHQGYALFIDGNKFITSLVNQSRCKYT